MPASMLGAIVSKYATLSFSGKPATLWVGEASIRNPDGSEVDLPLVEVYEEDSTVPLTFEYNPLCVAVRYRFEVWARTYESGWAVAMGILFNGSSPTSAAGIGSGCTLTYDSGSFSHRSVDQKSWPKVEARLDPRNPEAGRAYKVSWTIEVQAEWVGPA